MRLLRRNGHARPVVRILFPGEEGVEGTLVGRWDGHYQLRDAVWLTLAQDGMQRRRMDGHTCIQEDKAYGYQIVGEVVV